MGGRRDGWMDGYQYIYCLPSAGGRIRSQGNYCLPPAGVLHSQNKVINAPPTASHKGGGGGMGRWVGRERGQGGGAGLALL
jgi:hypothetical protein